MHMRVSLKRAVNRVVAEPLRERGWDISYSQGGDVWFHRLAGEHEHWIVFQRCNHFGECRGFMIRLRDMRNGIEMDSTDLAFIVSPMICPGDSWHYDTSDELEEWLRFLLPHLLETGLAWFDGQHDMNQEIRIRELNREMYKFLLMALGYDGVDLDIVFAGLVAPNDCLPSLCQAERRWERVRVPWFKSFLAGEKIDPPRMQ